ncbi:MAG: phosphate/phosphite/phosphonate ABC transporter substrate-binding protein [Gammaproteobacteria bacterium]|nr:phosphate/phosphite/phosphonate ABC transporter substrate-binding protein [Gammaproteobacteria bacterium]
MAAIFVAVLSTPVLAAEAKESLQVLTFGIVPQQSASKLARLWQPILEHLGKETQLQIHFRTAKNIPAFEERVRRGEYDLSYMNPYHYTVFHEAPGYQAFAMARDKKIKGIMVVRKDSGITDMGELMDRTLAFPAPAAFAASILNRSHLHNKDITFTPRYVSSHDSVYRSIAVGLYPAGGGVIRTLRNVDPKIREQLQILWTSQGYTPHAFAAHPGLDPKLVKRIQDAMTHMEQSEKGRRLLASIKLKGITAAANEEWDDVRGLHIELLDN